MIKQKNRANLLKLLSRRIFSQKIKRLNVHSQSSECLNAPANRGREKINSVHGLRGRLRARLIYFQCHSLLVSAHCWQRSFIRLPSVGSAGRAPNKDFIVNPGCRGVGGGGGNLAEAVVGRSRRTRVFVSGPLWCHSFTV